MDDGRFWEIGFSGAEIRRLLAVFKSETLSRSRVFERCTRFHREHHSVSDDDGAGTPHSAEMAVDVACVFWDSPDVILVDFVLSRSTVNAHYYSTLLSDQWLCAFQIYSECTLLQYTTLRPVTWPAIRRKRPNLLRKGVMLQHDNAAPQKARQTVEKVAVMGCQLLPHPPYSPDLAPSDFQPFGLLKQSLEGLKFEDDQQHVLKFIHITDKDFYATGFRRFV